MKLFTKYSGTPRISDRSLTTSFFKFLVEVVLIGIAVLLGLFANQWREARDHRALATATLRYFHEEALVNQKALATERQYHETRERELDAFLKTGGPKTRQTFDAYVHFRGIRPVIFEHTAWDLAGASNPTTSPANPQATQAYAYDPVGNRVGFTQNGTTTAYAVNNLNEYIQVERDANL